MLHFSIIEFFLVCLVTSNCYPIEEPMKFQLNAKDSDVENMKMPSKKEQAQIITADNVVSLSNDKFKLLNQGTKSLEFLRYPPSIFASTTNGPETVHLENESEQSLVEKTLIFPFKDLFVNILNPTPLVDQIKEEDKYGNTVNKTNDIGKAIINGYESFTKFLNSVLNSVENLKNATRSNIFDGLKQIGEKLTGLS